MNRRILLVAVAVVLALFGTIAVYGYAHNADKRAVADTKGTSVLVAGKRVPAGTTWADAVKQGLFTSEKMPADAAPQTALAGTTNAAIGNDAVAQFDIAPGQPVLREAFGTAIAKTGALTIPKGLTAVSVSLPAQATVAGYVVPGSQVSIYVTSPLTTKDSAKGAAGTALTSTQTLLPRVTVLATSQTAPTGVEGSSDSSSNSGGSELITFAVSQRDAERIVNQQGNGGSLYLSLLSPSSQVSDTDPGVANTSSLQPVPVYAK